MIKHIDEIDSTSRYMMDHPEWFDNLDVVSASHQTAGVGRTGHAWVDNKGDNILFSFIIKDEALISSFKFLSVTLGVIILNYLKGYISEDRLSLKWPNDVYVNNKKICGILLQGKLPDYVVVGIGFNLNQSDFGEMKENATSLSLELSQIFDVETMRESLCEYVVNALKHFDVVRPTVIDEFNSHNCLFRKEVTYFNTITNQEEDGIALGINDNGELLVSKGEKIIPLSASEVRQIR